MSIKRRAPHQRLVHFGTLASLMAAGCESSEPSPLGLRSEGDILSGGDMYEVPVGERLFADLAAEDSSFAGLVLDGERLVALTAQAERIESVRAVVERGRIGRVELNKAGGAPRPLDVRVVEYSYLALHEWRGRVFSEIRRLREFVSFDLDEGDNRLTIGLEAGFDDAEVRRILAVNDVPEAAVNIETVTRPTPAVGIAELTDISPVFGSGPDLHSFKRPLRGGYRFQWREANGVVKECTQGFAAVLGGDSVLIANSHCTREYYDVDGADAHQPAYLTGYGNYIGYEAVDPDPTCSGTCRNADAAAYQLVGVSPHVGYLAKPEDRIDGDGASLDIASDSTFIILGRWSNPIENTTVEKVGKSSGWTYGTVEDTCVWMDLESFFNQFEVTCLTVADYYSEDGDSGAPVFILWAGRNVYLSGINVGSDGEGEAYFSPLSMIEYDLGSLEVTPPPPPSPGASIAACDADGGESEVTLTFYTGDYTESVAVYRKVGLFGSWSFSQELDTDPNSGPYFPWGYYGSQGTYVDFSVRPFSQDLLQGEEGDDCVDGAGIE